MRYWRALCLPVSLKRACEVYPTVLASRLRYRDQLEDPRNLGGSHYRDMGAQYRTHPAQYRIHVTQYRIHVTQYRIHVTQYRIHPAQYRAHAPSRLGPVLAPHISAVGAT